MRDGRKQPKRGLWERNGRYYAQLNIPDPNTGQTKTRRVPLFDQDKQPVKTVAEAKSALDRLRLERTDDDLPILYRAPRFRDYVEAYFDHCKQAKDGKRPKTLQTERGHLNAWVKHLGNVRINKITRPMIKDFIDKRQAQGLSARTVNLSVVMLRNVLNRAIDQDYLRRLPTENLRPLKHTPRRRSLFSNMVCSIGIWIGQGSGKVGSMMAFGVRNVWPEGRREILNPASALLPPLSGIFSRSNRVKGVGLSGDSISAILLLESRLICCSGSHRRTE